MDNLAFLIGIGVPGISILGMYIFGLYTRRNIFWVFLSLIWGALVYLGLAFLTPNVFGVQIEEQFSSAAFIPLLQQGFIALGVWFVLWRENFDNLVDGTVYGWAAGLGFAAYENFSVLINSMAAERLSLTLVQAASISLVYGASAGIIGIAVTQFYFRHRPNRMIFLLSGFSAAVGYVSLYKVLAFYQIGGDFLVVAFGISGLIVVGLYIIGLLREILIQVGIQKRRADSLLDIVIPIGVELSTEDKFSRLLEKILLEAKSFCHADGGTLYLLKDDQLEYAVVLNDTLEIALGGTSENEISFPPLDLYDRETGEPDHNHMATYVALTGETVNIGDAYGDTRFDFSASKEFDKRTGYLSVSFLTIPLKDNAGNILGVLQLINSYNARRRVFMPFDENLQQLMESFSSLAAAALQGYIKEQGLRKEIQALRMEIDAVKREKQVAEITDTTYFQELQKKAKVMRNRND